MLNLVVNKVHSIGSITFVKDTFFNSHSLTGGMAVRIQRRQHLSQRKKSPSTKILGQPTTMLRRKRIHGEKRKRKKILSEEGKATTSGAS